MPQCKVSAEKSYAEYRTELERLVATGLEVKVSDKWQVLSECQMRPFKVVERSTGGAGVTKFYEVEVHCRALIEKIRELEPNLGYWIELPGLVPKAFQAVQSAVNFCAKSLEGLGFDPEPRRVGMWDDTSEFFCLGEHLPDPLDWSLSIIFISQNRLIFPIPLKKKVGPFSNFLCAFPEDSVEEISGRILHAAHNLFRDRGGKALYQAKKLDRSILDELHMIGRLHERLIWKVKYEPTAAVGKRAEEAQEKRAGAGGQTSAEARISRIKSLLFEIEKLLEANPDIGMVGLKKLAQLAGKKAKSKDPKMWSQGLGKVQEYLEDAEFDPNFSEQFQRIKAQTA